MVVAKASHVSLPFRFTTDDGLCGGLMAIDVCGFASDWRRRWFEKKNGSELT